jgi:hypothetical protein
LNLTLLPDSKLVCGGDKKRVKEPRKPRIKIDLLHKDSEGEVETDQIQDAMKLVEYVNEKAKLRGKKMKMDTVTSLIQAAH